MLLRNIYGWLERTERGAYRLAKAGQAAPAALSAASGAAE